LSKAQDRAAQLPKPRPVGDLSRALTAADKLGDISADIAKRNRALERGTNKLEQKMIGLGLGIDRVSLLREIAVPSEKVVARYTELLAERDKGLKAAQDTLAPLNRDMAQTDQRIAALKTEGDIATEDDLIAARDARDQGWQLVRALYVDRQS